MGSTGGIVAAGHESVARAGADMLRAGGNAFDAAIAAGFASSVAEPGFTSLAGGGFLLARTDTGENLLFDFFVDAPGRGLTAAERTPHFDAVTVRFHAADQAFHCGLGSVAVPGCLPGYLHTHRRLGRLPLEQVIAPAVRLAEEGVEVSETQAYVYGLLEPILARTEASRKIFFPHGRLLSAGDTLNNPDLGQFIHETGQAPDLAFRRGPAAEALVAMMADGHGLVTADDLAAYEVVERPPLTVPFHDRTVLTNPAPSFGGPLIAMALALLEERRPLPPNGSAAMAVLLAETMAEVDRRRAEALDRPDRPTATRGTTHVSVADDEGNVACMTTSNGECSGDVIPHTGVMLNNMLGEDDLHPGGFHTADPGTRVASMMAPTMVADRDGTVVLGLGSGGSKRIRSAIVQVLVATQAHGIDLDRAVAAPRIHWDGDHLELEPGLSDEVSDALAVVAATNVWPATSMYFGGVQAVVPGRVGVGDHRRGGSVVVVGRD